MNITHNDKALILDDSSVMLVALRRMCLGLGYVDENITQAKSPKAALLLVKRNQYNLVVCDYNFNTRINGRIFFDELKHNKSLEAGAVFIMVTGERVSNVVMSILELEPDEYYLKPFNPDFFVQRTKLAMKRKKILSPLYKLKDSKDSKDSKYLDQICDEIIFDHPEFYYQTLRIKGDLLSRQEKHDEALILYQEVLNSKKLEWAALGAADSLMELGCIEESGRIIDELLNSGSSSVKAISLAAKYNIYSGDIPNAIKHLSLASEIVPGNPDREYIIAILCLSESDFKNAASRFYQYNELTIDTYRYSPANIGNYIASCLMELDEIDNQMFFHDNHKSRDFQLLIQERNGLEKEVINNYNSYINSDSVSKFDNEDEPFVEFFSELIGAHLTLRKMDIKKSVSLLKKTFDSHNVIHGDEMIYLSYLLSKLSFHKEFSLLQESFFKRVSELSNPLERARLELIKKITENHTKKVALVNSVLGDINSKIKSQDKITLLHDLMEVKSKEPLNKKLNYYIMICLCECWPIHYGKREVLCLIDNCFGICNELMTNEEKRRIGLHDLYDRAILKVKS